MQQDDGMTVVRLEDAAAAAQNRQETHYAYLRFDVMAHDEIAIALVEPDDAIGWRLTILQGSYGGYLRITSTGHPPRGVRRQIANQVFHAAEARIPADLLALAAPGRPAPSLDVAHAEMLSTVDAVRIVEGYDADAVLHPDAIRTVVRARQARDSRVPNAQPSAFSGLLRFTGIAGGVLVAANTLALMVLFATWGHTSPILRQAVISVTLATLAALCLCPFLITRLSRESRLFVSDGAQQQGRAATLRTGQLAILLAFLALVNGLVALS